MVAVKAYQAEAFLKSPDPRLTAFLFYGPDAGLVAERALDLARKLAARDTPPGEILRFDDADLETDPDRIAIEIGTVPMFGGRKIVRVSMGRRITTSTLKPLIGDTDGLGVLIIEGGNLKPDDTLRTHCERSDKAAAVACYADEVRDLDAVVRDLIDKAGLSITPDARQLLIARLGADRALSRSEIEKLTLYALDNGTIDADDVDAIVGDASELATDRIVTAAASGDGSRAVKEFARAVSAGESAQAIIAATERYFHRLHRLRTTIDAGRSFDDAARQLRPALHFKQKDAVAAQCRAWTTARLGVALSRIAAAAETARLAGPIEDAHAERLLIDLAELARPGRPAAPSQRRV